MIKRFLVATGTLLLGSFFLIMGSNLAFSADMCQIIRIEKATGGASGTRIEIIPEKITVPVGSCTVWVNWIVVGEVQVSFRENAKACVLSTESPSGFHEEQLKVGESCYLTEPLARGRSASLYWTKPGVYKYTIELVGTSKGEAINPRPEAVGIIEVK